MAEPRTRYSDPFPGIYKICFRGRVDARWVSEFDRLTLNRHGEDSCLTGVIIDQAELYGLLRRTRDLGLPLISVLRIATPGEGEKS